MARQWRGDAATQVRQRSLPGLSNVVAIAAGKHHSLALKADGQLVAWGNNAKGQSMVPAGLTNVVAVCAGGSAEWSNSRYRSYSLAIPIRLQVANFYVTNGVPQISFRTFQGQQYSVQSSSSLSPDAWSDLLGGSVRGNGQDAMIADPFATGDAVRFYRIKQQ
jgi:hypothetical protein